MADAPDDRSDPRTPRARRLRRDATSAEKALWKALRLLDLPGGHFRRQVPFDQYFADFAHHGFKLVVEIDGPSHSDEAQRRRDAARTAAFERSGYRVLRFWNEEVFTNSEGVVETVLAATLPAPPPTPNPSPPQAGGGGRSRRLLLIGIGTGGLAQLTLEAVAALNEASVVLVLDKREETADLTEFRRRVCERHVRGRAMRIVAAQDPPRDRGGDYEAGVEAWHAARADLMEALIAREVPEGGCGAVLVWGDPSLYDSTLRIVDRIRARGRLALDHAVIPGIASPQVLAARHRIALNRIGGAVHVTTGRRLAAGWPDDADDVVVMLDGAETFQRFLGRDLTIHWGAYLGSPEEILVAGPLDAVAEEISMKRAAARARLGWIMDCYLLRRPPTRPAPSPARGA